MKGDLSSPRPTYFAFFAFFALFPLDRISRTAPTATQRNESRPIDAATSCSLLAYTTIAPGGLAFTRAMEEPDTMGDWTAVPGNEPAWRRLVELVRSGDALGFVGQVASTPPYLAWHKLPKRLLDATPLRETEQRSGLQIAAVAARTNSIATGEAVAKVLGWDGYLEALTTVYRSTDTTPSYSPLQHRIATLPFRGVLTTAYDLGLVDAFSNARSQTPQVFTWIDLDTDELLSRPLDQTAILYVCGVPETPDSIIHLRSLFQPGRLGPPSEIMDPYRHEILRLWKERPMVLLTNGPVDSLARDVAVALQKRIPAVETLVRRHVALLPCHPEGIDDAVRAHHETLYGAEILFYPSESESESQDQIIDILNSLSEALTRDDDSMPAAKPPSAAPSEVITEDETEQAEPCVFKLKGEICKIAFEGETGEFKSSKGFLCLRVLLNEPGRKFQPIAIELIIAPPPATPAASTGRTEGLSVGRGHRPEPVADRKTLAVYHESLAELDREIEEAKANHDDGTLRMKQEAKEATLAEIRKLTGRRGKPRSSKSSEQAAYDRVVHAVNRAMKKLKTNMPKLHSHLQRSLTRESEWSYDPETSREWRT